ncbi:MAG: M1 family metallopeptidase, partial [Gemmatimonadetes bacterium]|nr:M1 family metallopeptidase [Gemmatimonadota bacterium]NIU32947.1 M1 family metallopeptidase [Gemmatimonadota bacterium]NIV63306.1 M1 family peptidase [Gemmatimonadota bacterium]NIW66024.1 M1 family peptidase [Gemmatimonadota bacterium]NIX41318.1 M1 family peptidase [Gemmatimonadota bacterium]
SILRGINRDFARSTVTTDDIERYIERESGLPLGPVFDQYLRTTRIPVLEWRIEGTELSYRWSDVVDGFAMPVTVHAPGGVSLHLRPVSEWRT